MFCKKCGNQLNDDEKYCSKCGTPVDGVSAGQEKKQKSVAAPQPKTKLGISVGLLAAIAYFSGLLGGIGLLAILVIVGYAFLAESDSFLRKSAIKALTIGLCFVVAGVVINLIPDLLRLINTMLGIFGTGFTYGTVRSIFATLEGILDIAEKVLFVLLGVFALCGKTIRIPGIDDLIEKYVK